MAVKTIDSNVSVTGTLATTGAISQNGSNVVISGDVTDVVEISQAAYDALGGGRPAGRLYLVTS